ncbi:MAG: phage tail tube protein [Candidatus Bathyarchaeota archaeon]|jgi:hypothetical protein
MAFADTANYSLAYAPETTFDTPPTTGYRLLRNTGEGLNVNIESAQSDEIDSDAQYTGTVQVSGSSAGPVNFQLSYAEYDDFLEAVLRSADWDAGYSDSATDVASRVFTGLTDTTGLLPGMIVKVTGLTASAEDGVFTIETVNSGTSFTVVESLTDEASGTITVTNSGYIMNGTTQRSFSFEKNFIVDGSDNFFLMSGMRAASMSMAMSTGSIVSGSFNFQGATGQASASSQEASSYSAANTNELMNAVSNINGMSMYAVDVSGNYTAISATFQELSLSIDNSMRDQSGIGNLFPAGIGAGRIKVEANATLYFADRDLFDQFIVNGSVQIRFQITDAEDNYGNRYGFVFPEMKIASHEVVASGPDSDVMASVQFTAQKDVRSGTSKSIIVSKIDAV